MASFPCPSGVFMIQSVIQTCILFFCILRAFFFLCILHEAVIVQIKIEDAERADEAFSILMGEQVEPRRQFIEKNAKYANLDV